MPENRVRFSKDELIQLVKENQMLRMEIRKMQMLNRVPLEEMIDFQKLTKAFFRDHPYEYGKRIRPLKKSNIGYSSSSDGEKNTSTEHH